MSGVYAELFGIPQIGLRFFSVYGPWGRPDMAYWLFTDAILRGRPIKRLQQRRDAAATSPISTTSCRRAGGRGCAGRAGGEQHRIYNIGNSRAGAADGHDRDPGAAPRQEGRASSCCRCSRARCRSPTPTSRRSRRISASGRARARGRAAALRRLVPPLSRGRRRGRANRRRTVLRSAASRRPGGARSAPSSSSRKSQLASSCTRWCVMMPIGSRLPASRRSTSAAERAHRSAARRQQAAACLPVEDVEMRVDPMRRRAEAGPKVERPTRPACRRRRATASAMRFQGGTSTGRNWSGTATRSRVEAALKLVEDRRRAGGGRRARPSSRPAGCGCDAASRAAARRRGGSRCSRVGKRSRRALRDDRQRRAADRAAAPAPAAVRARGVASPRRRRATRTRVRVARARASSSSATKRCSLGVAVRIVRHVMRPARRARRCAACAATKSMPGSEENFSRTFFAPASPSRRRKRRIVDQRAHRLGKRVRVLLRHQPAGLRRASPVPGCRKRRWRAPARAKACASISTFGSPSRSPDARQARGEHEEVGALQQVEDEGAVLRAVPDDPVGDAEPSPPAPSAAAASGPPPACSKRQSRSSRSSASACSRSA